MSSGQLWYFVVDDEGGRRKEGPVAGAGREALIATNDYHAGPLVLTKLDLLGFLTAMESSSRER